jgi:hypothetical protein
MNIIQFTLTMPNIGSWNGHWTGEDELFAKCRSYGKQDTEKIMQGKPQRSWYYNFGDGWGANVDAKIITAKEARTIRNKSHGFCGYDWMIDSIEQNDKIIVEVIYEQTLNMVTSA